MSAGHFRDLPLRWGHAFALLGELARRVRLITDRGARTAGVGEHSEMVEAWNCGIVLFG